MKTRNFILSMFMMMFCSMAFGQNWGDFNYHNYPNNMTVNAVVSIDGELQSNADLTIAPYCGDVRRGEPTNAKLTMTGQYMAEVLIYGETNGDNITFKLYDGECMYDNLADYNVDFTANAVYGDLRNPVAVNFKAIAQVGDKKYGSDIQSVCWAPGAIVFEKSDRCRVENCYIHGVGVHGIEIGSGCHDIRIENNLIEDICAGGVKIVGASEDGETAVTRNCTVRGNFLSNTNLL